MLPLEIHAWNEKKKPLTKYVTWFYEILHTNNSEEFYIQFILMHFSSRKYAHFLIKSSFTYLLIFFSQHYLTDWLNLSMCYRWAVSCCRSWRSTLTVVLTPGCSVRGSTFTVSCPTPSPRRGHSRSCTCSAGPRPSSHRRCTASWGES